MDKTCIYLRKSRADEEAEKVLGQGETLSKHRKALLSFAKQKKLNIVEIKEEVVSGDSLFFRPKMLELLKEVENNQYTGVLVMDIDRLGRGGMKDQGIILEAFKESHTAIITPNKTYDLNNDADEEMTEFKTFFARRELKVITKRMQGGRIRSVQDGNYIATNPPLGYEIAHIKTYRTLKPIPAEADIVKMIYKMYLDGNGAKNIANYLNSLGIKTKAGNQFVPSAVIFILKNPIYIGKVTWKKKEIKKSKDPGKVKDTRSRDKSEWIISDGKHEPIIDIETFNNVQKILNGKYHIPYQLKNAPVNPLAGIITCGVCGKKMVMRKLRGIPRMLCITSGCSNVSTRFDIFEKDMITALRDYLNNYKISVKSNNKTSNIEILEKQSTLLNKELNTLNNQKLKLFDLLERNIYTEEVFLERSKNIENRIATVSSELSNINSQIQSSSAAINKKDIINFENVLNAYESTTDVKTKNELLKNILYKIEYKKDKNCKGNDFEIKLYPKILR